MSRPSSAANRATAPDDRFPRNGDDTRPTRLGGHSAATAVHGDLRHRRRWSAKRAHDRIADTPNEDLGAWYEFTGDGPRSGATAI